MNELNKVLKEGKFDSNHRRYRALSRDARSLIKGLMNKDVTKRLTVQ